MKKIYSNKKGELTLTAVAKIVLSVFGIFLLLLLSTSLYGIFTAKSKIEQASVNLENIVDIVNKLEEGSTRSYVLEGPKDWDLFLYPPSLEVPISNVCGGKDCICLCEGASCGGVGICKPIEFSTFFSMEPEFDLSKIPQEIFIIKTSKGKIIITDDENLKVEEI